jgi:hypothetical protein
MFCAPDSVQEYTLARRIEIWSSQIKIKEEVLRYAMKSSGPSVHIGCTDTPAMRIMSSRHNRQRSLDSIEKRREEPPNHDSFMSLIIQYETNMRCADARDRVYALLSLLTREEREVLELTPDYTKSALEVYTHIANILRRDLSTYVSKWSDDVQGRNKEIEFSILMLQRMLLGYVQA